MEVRSRATALAETVKLALAATRVPADDSMEAVMVVEPPATAVASPEELIVPTFGSLDAQVT